MADLTRRDFLAAAVAAATTATAANIPNDGAGLVRPSAAQLRWQDLELAALFCLDLHTYIRSNSAFRRGRGWPPAPDRLPKLELYNPKKLDTDQWLAAAKAMGAKYAHFTASHENGLLQWQSDLPHGLKDVMWWRGGKGDIVKDFVASCHKYHIKPGIYIGLRRNAFWEVWERKVNWGKGGDEAKQKAYDDMCVKQVTELCTRYGDWVEVWFDAGGSDRVKEVVMRLQPNAIFYHSPGRWDHRWAGTERGIATYPCWSTYPYPGNKPGPLTRNPKIRWGGDPNGKHWVPCWADAPIINHSWFWTGREKPNYYSAAAFVNMYRNSIGRNANLSIGLDINPDGLIDDAEIKRCEELGKELRRRFGKPLATTKGTGKEVTLALPKPQRIDHVGIMEDIAHGERVREYVVEGLVGPDQWRKLCEGISVGHRRIQRFAPTEVAKVRLRVTKSVATPRIRSLYVHNAG